MKRLLVILLAVFLCVPFFACNGNSLPVNPFENPDQAPDSTPQGPISTYTTVLPEAQGVTDFVQFVMQDGSAFIVELRPDKAPITVENFKNLVTAKFYNGLTFHRVTKQLIQGGEPNEQSEAVEPIVGEFAANGYEYNDLPHARSVISMARTSIYDSANSQFFITRTDSPYLNGKYAAFGYVVAGMETIDALSQIEVTWQTISNEKSKPLVPPVIQSAYFVEYTPPAAE